VKIFTLLLFSITLLFSKSYYSKVEPYEIRNISANVAGLVTYINENKIGETLSSSPFIKLDAELSKDELKALEDKITYLRGMVQNSNKVLENLKASLEKKRVNFKRIEKLSIKSVVEKDREFYDLINSENLYLNTQKEISNLNVQITDLKLRKAQVKRAIKDKSIVAEGFVLYSISVMPGQVVGVGTPLAKVADTSFAKLTIYLDEIDDVYKKVVYIDGKKTDYKVSRVLNIADAKNISKYMAQIIIPSPKLFSKLVKVELRDE
jgi:hypothetical protein